VEPAAWFCSVHAARHPSSCDPSSPRDWLVLFLYRGSVKEGIGLRWFLIAYVAGGK